MVCDHPPSLWDNDVSSTSHWINAYMSVVFVLYLWSRPRWLRDLPQVDHSLIHARPLLK